MAEKKKTYVEDIERTLYDIKNEDHSVYKSHSGLTPEIVRDISKRKNDPEWMTEFRLKSLEVYNSLELPTWGPSLEELNMDDIVTYVQPDAKMTGSWEEVPEDIKDTFDRLGIPEAEKTSLGGVGAQYDSEVVYHSIQEDMVKQGVIYTDMETALVEHGDIVKEYFMTLVPPKDHKFAALHGAVWSGGSFVYVPEGVHVEMPLQSYFRLNAAGAGQRGEEYQNLEKKRDVISRLKAAAEEAGDGLQERVQQLVEEYQSIGHVPFKEKDKLYEEYHAVLDKLYKELNISVAKRRLSKFKDNLKQVAERGGNALDNERARLMRQYEQLKSEVQTYENNLGFLNASSRKGNSLIDEMNRKVQKLKDEVQLVRDKIKTIDAENAKKEE